MTRATYGRTAGWTGRLLKAAEEVAGPGDTLTKAAEPLPAAETVEELARERLDAGREDTIEKARASVYRDRRDLARQVREQNEQRHSDLMEAKREAAESLRKVAEGEAASWTDWILTKASEAAAEAGGRPRSEDVMQAARAILREFPGAAEHLRAENLDI